MGLATSLFFLFLQLCVLVCASDDVTLVPKKSGRLAVNAVHFKLEESFIFSRFPDMGFFERVAAVESDFGTGLYTYPNNFNGGIWKVSEENYQKTKNKALQETFNQLNSEFGINWLTSTWKDLEKPLFSGIAFAILLESYGVHIPTTIRGQGEFWKKYYNTNLALSVDSFVDKISVLEQKPECHLRANLVIILDGSGSVGYPQFETAKLVVANLTTGIYNPRSNMSFIVYSSVSNLIIHLSDKHSLSEIQQLILEANYPAGGTLTDLAIDLAVREFSNLEPSTPRIIVTMTDGDSNFPDKTKLSASRAAAKGILMFSVGIGSNILEAELDILAGEMPERRLTIDNFDALPELIYRIGSGACGISSAPFFGETVEDLLGSKETRYFKYELPEKGITIERRDVSGRTVGYYSYSFPKPFAGLNDGRLQEKGKTFITKSNSSDVYIAIQGVRQENNYTLTGLAGNTRRKPTAIRNTSGLGLLPCAGFTDSQCDATCGNENWSFGTCALYLCICDE